MSTGQTLDAQLVQLFAGGCVKVYREKASGAQANRRELLSGAQRVQLLALPAGLRELEERHSFAPSDLEFIGPYRRLSFAILRDEFYKATVGRVANSDIVVT